MYEKSTPVVVRAAREALACHSDLMGLVRSVLDKRLPDGQASILVHKVLNWHFGAFQQAAVEVIRSLERGASATRHQASVAL